MKSQASFVLPLAILLFVMAAYFLAGPLVMSVMPPCPFYFFTGLYCPGCGSQRAITALLHGHILQAIGFNILLVISLPVLAIGVLSNTSIGWAKPLQKFWYSKVFVRSVFCIILLFWISRNVPVYPFTLLAP